MLAREAVGREQVIEREEEVSVAIKRRGDYEGC
jgi:hypothetical protein